MEPVELRLALDEAAYGGKSVQLGASLRQGLPVPPGWALSVDLVDALVEGDAAALAGLRQFLADKPDPFAVRSSGVGEDASIASFAGQHFTELNRIGFDEILDAVRLVWDSGHGEGARAYRARLGIDGRPRTAVTLQKMVRPDVSGVMFTRHPVTGADEIVIEASWGLGEAIVEGIVIPDRFRLAKGGAVKERIAGTKDLEFCALPTGRVEERPITDAARVNGLCIDDTTLGALGRLAMQCEQAFGPGRDIEWAIEGQELYLLQCRSITTGRAA